MNEEIRVGDYVWVWGTDGVRGWKKVEMVSLTGDTRANGVWYTPVEVSKNPVIPPKPKKVTYEVAPIDRFPWKVIADGDCVKFAVPKDAQNVKCTYEIEE